MASYRAVCATALFLCACSGQEVPAEVNGSINEDGYIVLSAEGEGIVGIDLQSIGGHLVPIPPGDLSADAAPFEYLLANSPTQVTLGNLSAAIPLDGELVLPIGYDGRADPAVDVSAVWGGRQSDFPVAFSVAALETTPEPASSTLLAVALMISLLSARRKRR